ncbi:MAG: ATP-dependent DNA ligase [Acidimicrobiia bacterium]
MVLEAVPQPMLAKAIAELPNGADWQFEPKWDGFRAIADRRHGVTIHSRSGRPLERYFPEVAEALEKTLPSGVVIDGEIIIPTERGCDFDLLTARIHPAASRVTRLAAETPAVFVAFDLLAVDARDERHRPLAERVLLLDEVLAANDRSESVGSVLRTPSTRDQAEARDWFSRFEGAGLDGIVAKQIDGAYVGGARTWGKLKHHRSADCVLAGYRMHKDGAGVGALLLGLHDDAERLHYVGAIGAFSAATRRDLLEDLADEALGVDDSEHPWLIDNPAAHGIRIPGELNRWNAKKMRDWVAVPPERVVEVEFDQLQSNRFRHNAKLVRWRTDRTAASCTMHQLEVASPVELRAFINDTSSKS